MARIPDEELERIKRETDLVALVQAAGVALRRHGANLVGRCPLHDDADPSLVVTPAKGLWHCMGACQAGGSVIDWVMRTERVSFRHAVERLRGPLGRGNPMSAAPAVSLAPIARNASEAEALDDAALGREVVTFYHETLQASPEAIAYLEARALGNVVQHDQNRDYWATGRVSDSYLYNGPHLGAITASPLAYLRNGDAPVITTLTQTYQTYDASGNQIGSNTYDQSYDYSQYGVDFYDVIPGVGQSYVRSYFDAAERLRVSQRLYFFTDPGSNQRGRTTFQEYFYDALGRRVAMRSRRDSTCTDAGDPTPGWDCAQTMERFVWDGDQLLAELRDYGKWGDDASTLNGNGGSTGNFYGQVKYAYGLNLFGPDAPLLLLPGNLGGVIVPQASWRGTVESGTGPDGGNITSYSWPGQQQGLYLAPDARITPILENRWIGSLVEGKVDGAGLVYDRNRYYDPTGGRFTQEDPAGLSGGLNLYGYAGADPANNSDPFGLCPICIAAAGAALEGAIEGAAVGAGEQIALNAIHGRPAGEGVLKATAAGAGVGAVTAGVGAAVRVLKVVSDARSALGFAEAGVASEAEANAAVDQFAGDGSRPIKDRGTGETVGIRNDATGDQGRYVHTDKGRPTPHANLENAAGGNTHVDVKPSGTKSWWPW